MPTNTLPRSPFSRFALLAALIAVLGLTLGACGSDGSSKSSSTPDTADITIKDLKFSATPVAAGATVTVHNRDDVTHTVTADDKSFDVTVDGGDDITFTAPDKAGSFKFHCNIHSGMNSTLTVT
jgi:plastocyanin